MKGIRWVKLDSEYPPAGKYVSVRDQSGYETGGVWIDELKFGDLTLSNYWHLVGSLQGDIYEWALVEPLNTTTSGKMIFNRSDRSSRVVPKN